MNPSYNLLWTIISETASLSFALQPCLQLEVQNHCKVGEAIWFSQKHLPEEHNGICYTERSHFTPSMNTPTTNPWEFCTWALVSSRFLAFILHSDCGKSRKKQRCISGRLISCLVRRGGRKLERSPKETRTEMLSIWLALSCPPDMEHGIFTNNETTGKGMGAICPFSNSISGTSVTMRNHLCHSSWHCLTVPNFSCNTRGTQRVTAQKKGMSGALQTLDLLVIETLLLYFYF